MDQESIYIGNRYVPKMEGEWNQLKEYEGLSIVTLNGSSYTSKKMVPQGVAISNEAYWVKTGDYNAQVEEFKNDFTAQLAQTMSQVEFDSWVATLLDGGPSIFMDSLSALTLAYPEGAEGVALVRETETSKIYVWNGTDWADYGDYKGIVAKDGSISWKKTNFIHQGKNIVNKSNMIPNTTINYLGVTSVYEGTHLVDYSDVLPATTYTPNQKEIWVIFYDDSKRFITGSVRITDSNPSFTTPSNCFFIRTSIQNAFVNNFQIEKGLASTPFEPYELTAKGISPDIKKVNKNDFKGNYIKDFSTPYTALEFVKRGKNLVNPKKLLKDHTINSNGEIIPYVGAYVTEPIPVEPNSVISASASRFGAFTDMLGTFVSGTTIDQGTPVPKNAHYVQMALHSSVLNEFQLEYGTASTPFEEFKLTLFENEPVSFGNLIQDEANTNNMLKNEILVSKQKDISVYGHAECLIPTFDNDLSVGHPSVIYKKGGWNGYEYWMAFTPYPSASREDPSIVASKDGIVWETPSGLLNPIFKQKQSEAMGYGSNSDTHLILSKDGLTLIVYWRSMGTNGESINIGKSTNGTTWVLQTEILTKPIVNGAIVSILSPAVLIEPDGSYSMWSVNQNGTDKTKMVEKRTSTDGITWSVLTQCTLSNVPFFTPYHLDVQLLNGTYYMLLASNDAMVLKFLTSQDGLTWVYNTTLPKGSYVYPDDVGSTIPFSGFEWDKNQHYRSCFIPKSNGKFDLWINGIKLGVGNAWSNDAEWRIAYYPDVDLTNGLIATKRKTKTYSGSVLNAPTSANGFANGDRYEYTNPTNFLGKVVANGEWKNFGAIV